MEGIRLVVGLGNPGSKYENTRHNVGFLVLQAYAHLLGWEFREERRFEGRYVKGKVEGQTVCLLMPSTYMNASGRSVRKLMDFYKWHPEQVLVVVDDVALELGDLRLRERGSAGGHNGLKDIQSCLGTQDYSRLRVGVGSHRQSGDLSQHVLGAFTRQEGELLMPAVQKSVDIIHRLLRGDDLSRVMNEVNRKKRVKEKIKENHAQDEADMRVLGQESKDGKRTS